MCEKRWKLAFERRLPSLSLIFVFLTITILFYFYPCMWLIHNLSMAVPIIQTFFVISCCLNYVVCVFIDPGILCRDPEDPSNVLEAEEVTINGTTFTKKWCQVCRFFRPPRCRHCYTCNVCVEDLDHHCTLMNACIGKRNYRFFFFLLLSLVLFILLVLAFCLAYVFLNTHERYTVEKICTLILASLSGIISFPLTYFFIFHFCLISTGKTTYEQYIGVYKSKPSPFSQGCLKNVSVILFSPLPPSTITSTSAFPNGSLFVQGTEMKIKSTAERMSLQGKLQKRSSVPDCPYPHALIRQIEASLPRPAEELAPAPKVSQKWLMEEPNPNNGVVYESIYSTTSIM